ncbi:acetyltransferase [Agrobacterium larrymoorei]|uniref:Acetyltransferase n=1 Tax=Agrobacterium larrymoorei TaxID=160699 RepID=A0A4D7DT49_9HYPH|nr:acetyltransferase [Agrobacterium larrymoorei]QCI98787.1 acetyltransferase [Agrobacterium larrymoorei]QYA08326.1 acetyltransferase [Agrobacterium larrymoorei]WHA40872.1 acetyltransferase [Agrobacterium larrymoorei]
MTKKLLIVGAGEFADIAYEYFTNDSSYDVVGFAVEETYRTGHQHHGLPLVDVERCEQEFPPDDVSVHIAITSTELNRVRERLYLLMKSKGYVFANYISSHAFVWRTAIVGENVFIFENNVVQHGVEIGDGVVMWSGNHIGHQSKIGAFSFLSSHCVISGYCKIGRRSFIGVNATFADHIVTGDDCFVALAAVVNKSFPDPGILLTGHPAAPSKVSSYRYFKLKA